MMKLLNRFLPLLLTVLMTVSLLGCKEMTSYTGVDALSNGAEGEGIEAGGAAPIDDDELDEEEGEDSATAKTVKLPYIEVKIPVYNRDSLYAKLYDPWQKPESDEEDEDEDFPEDEEEARPRYQYPLVVLLHSLNGSHRDWGTLPAKLVKAGYAVLALDMRGHQRSALRGRGWRNFGQDDWPKLVSDVSLILNYFPNLDEYPQVDKTRTILIGSSIGANVALLAAAKNPEPVQAVVALSPGIDYKGLDAIKASYRYQKPVLMVASQNDLASFESTQILYRIVRGPKDLQLYRNIGHGTDMIRFYPALQDKVVSWLSSAVPPTEMVIEYPPDEEDFDEE